MDVTARQIKNALQHFDSDLREQPEWSNWWKNNNYKYSIFHDFKIYPVKQILSTATEVSKADFSGGNQSNTAITKAGFKIISLRAASWSIESGTVARKILDKSSFQQGTVIPIEVRPFFLEYDLQIGKRQPVILSINGREFDAYIAIENSPAHRTRLFWSKSFIREMSDTFPDHLQHAKEDLDFSRLPVAVMSFEREIGFERYRITLEEEESGTKEWSEDELEETVKAYLLMLRMEKDGEKFNKSLINNELREGVLNKRTKSSVEYRMQNISAIFEELCLPRIQGYVPAKNVGESTKEKIRDILIEQGAYDPTAYTPAADKADLDEKVRKILKSGIVGIPKGQPKPIQFTTTTTTYARDPLVKAWVLSNADGICEACESKAPFIKNDGEPYLESHHVISLSEGGPDTIENSVAICPNCHCRFHFSKDKGNYISKLYLKVSRLMQIR